MDNSTVPEPWSGTIGVVEPTLRLAARTLTDAPLFSTADALGWGISKKDLAILVRRELILRIDRGWYSTMVSADVEQLHVLRTIAALRMHDGPVAAAHSAVLLHGLPLARADLGTVELVRTSEGHGGTRRGVRVRSASGLPTTEVDLPIVGGTGRAVDAASAVVGTALVNSPLAALVAADEAVRLSVCTAAEIDLALDHARRCNGINGAREVLRLLDPRHESPGETLTHWVLHGFGWELIPQWRVQFGSRSFRLDFRVEGERVAIEYDGRAKLELPGAQVKLETRQMALEGLGWVFVRVVSEDLDDPAELHRRVREAVVESRRAA